MRIPLVKVHCSWLRPFTYLTVSGTNAYTASDKLTCEYMSSLRHVDFSISVDDSRPVRVWRELLAPRYRLVQDIQVLSGSFGQTGVWGAFW